MNKIESGLYHNKKVWHGGFKEVFFRFSYPDIIDYLKPSKEKKLLEIGCGYGRETQEFGNLFKEVVGLDISKGTIERAKKYAKQNKKENLKFYVYPDEIQNLEPESFDCLYSYTVFQHCPDNIVKILLYDGTLMLKSGGIFLLNFLNKQFDNRPQKHIPKSYTRGYYNISRNHEEVIKLFDNTGLIIEKIIQKEVKNKLFEGIAIQDFYIGKKK